MLAAEHQDSNSVRATYQLGRAYHLDHITSVPCASGSSSAKWSCPLRTANNEPLAFAKYSAKHSLPPSTATTILGDGEQMRGKEEAS